ncbi:MAG TPA: hypothetical protein VNA24_34760 [Hyalangium sp.]|jgi:hypothetical protein|nr:hypothetical protein [Hyalangium sp.]
MSDGASLILDFSKWDGTPFFQAQPEEGRHVYVVRKGEGTFDAYGVVEPDPRYIFRVRGTSEADLERFVAQVKSEGAEVTYGPPYETKNGGEKPPPPSGTPSGYKGSKPATR